MTEEAVQEVSEETESGDASKGRVTKAKEAIGEKYAAASENVKAKYADASKVAKEKYEGASKVAKEKYDGASKIAKEKYQQAKGKVQEIEFDEVTEKVRDYVRDNPGKAILMSVGVGFLIGLLLRRDD